MVPANDLACLSPAEQDALERLRLGALTLPQLMDELLALLAEVDPATGELSTRVADAIDRLNLSLERKVEAYAHVATRLQAEHDAYKGLADGYRKKAEQRERERAALRSRLQTQFERLQVERVKTPTVTAYLQRASTPALELTVLDDAEVPDQFCDRVVNMQRIRVALERGEVLAFARFETRKHLRFR